MISILNVVSFILLIGIIIIGIVLKIYTTRRLSDIDGMGPVIHQDVKTKHIIAELGD